MSPADLAASALGVGVDTVASVERLKHGLTNESWLVWTNETAVVVRISNAAEDALQIDRRSEAAILAAVSDAGIGPPVILCDPDRHVLVTRYLGDTWTAQDASGETNIGRLGRLLRRLHQIAIPTGVRHVELASTIEGYLNTLDQHGAHPALTEQSLRDGAREAARKLSGQSRPRLCHNDVHSLNIVDSGELRLLDWEYAGIGEPAFDLASVCVYHGYDRRQREWLLSSYGCRPGEITRQQLELACWLFEYIRDLWGAVRQVVGDDKE